MSSVCFFALEALYLSGFRVSTILCPDPNLRLRPRFGVESGDEERPFSEDGRGLGWETLEGSEIKWGETGCGGHFISHKYLTEMLTYVFVLKLTLL